MQKEKNSTSKIIIIGTIVMLIIISITIIVLNTKKTTINTGDNSEGNIKEQKIVSDTLKNGKNKLKYSYERIDDNHYGNLKLNINETEINTKEYFFSSKNYNDVNIELLNNYIVISIGTENDCKSMYNTLIVLNYKGEINYVIETKNNDIDFSLLRYNGNYKYDKNSQTIDLEYTLSCDTNCSVCGLTNNEGKTTKNIYNMTCEELDDSLKNTAGKITSKLDLSSNNITETIIKSEKLQDDNSGYNNDIKTRLNKFYQEKCLNN